MNRSTIILNILLLFTANCIQAQSPYFSLTPDYGHQHVEGLFIEEYQSNILLAGNIKEGNTYHPFFALHHENGDLLQFEKIDAAYKAVEILKDKDTLYFLGIQSSDEKKARNAVTAIYLPNAAISYQIEIQDTLLYAKAFDKNKNSGSFIIGFDRRIQKSLDSFYQDGIVKEVTPNGKNINKIEIETPYSMDNPQENNLFLDFAITSLKVADDEILVGSTHKHDQTNNPFSSTNATSYYIIDQNFNISYSWTIYPSSSTEMIYPNDFQKIDQNQYLITGVASPVTSMSKRVGLIKSIVIDHEFRSISTPWQTASNFVPRYEVNLPSLTPHFGFHKSIYNTHDSTYLAVGLATYSASATIEDSTRIYGANIIKAKKGERIFYREYHHLNYLPHLQYHHLKDFTILSNGDIVAFGHIEHLYSKKSIPWLLKLDENGCLNDDCMPVSAEIPEKYDFDFHCYPNPTSSFLNLSFKLPPNEQQARIDILNLNGQTLHAQTLGHAQTELQLDVHDYAPGIYLARLQLQNGAFEVVKFLVQ